MSNDFDSVKPPENFGGGEPGTPREKPVWKQYLPYIVVGVVVLVLAVSLVFGNGSVDTNALTQSPN